MKSIAIGIQSGAHIKLIRGPQDVMLKHINYRIWSQIRLLAQRSGNGHGNH